MTFFSVLMALLFSTVFILLVHLLRKNKLFLRNFGIVTVLFLYATCFARMVMIIEFPFTRVVSARRLYNTVVRAGVTHQLVLGQFQMSWLKALLYAWIISSACILILFLWNYCRKIRTIGQFQRNTNPRAEKVLETIKEEAKRDLQVHICVCPGVEIPFAVGIFRKQIILPAQDFTEEELYYILKHEYTHICNRDLIITMLVYLFRCVLWWNPAVYLLQKDVRQMLEIKCDMVATEGFTKQDKFGYLSLLFKLSNDAPSDKNSIAPRISTNFLNRKKDFSLVERFEFIAKPVRKASMAFQAIVLGVCLVVLLGSYSFVLQPAFDPPVEEMHIDGISYEVNISSPEWYLKKHKDGSFSMENKDGKTFPIKIDSVKLFIDRGLEIVEE